MILKTTCRWCVSSWWHWFWSVYSIYHMHTMYYSCILSDWNERFLRDIYIPGVGLAMRVCRMARYWYCYSLLIGFKYIYQLYSSRYSILWYGYRYHMTLCIGQLDPITVYRTGVWCALFLCWMSKCALFTNSPIMCHLIMMAATIIGSFMAILFS